MPNHYYAVGISYNYNWTDGLCVKIKSGEDREVAEYKAIKELKKEKEPHKVKLISVVSHFIEIPISGIIKTLEEKGYAVYKPGEWCELTKED